MDNLIELAMQIIFCLLIAAILGAIIGYLLGKMSKCDKDEYDLNPNGDKKDLNDYASEENDIRENISSSIDKTKGLTATGIASVGAVGAGIYEGTKDIGSNIEDNIKDFGSEVNEHVVDDSSAVSKELKENYTDPISVGQEIGIRPVSVEEPSNGEVDDLKEVSGIGLKIEEILNSLGIYYFHQISEWTPENIEWIENYLSVKRRVKKEDWIGQATLLSTGGETDFSKKVQRGENRNYN